MRTSKMHLFLVPIVSIFFIQGNCHHTPGGASRGVGTKKCPFESTDWMKVTATYNRTTVVNLAGRIGAAANIDAASIGKAGGNATIGGSDSLSRTITEAETHTAEVSQEFYEAYVKSRTALCNMYGLANSPAFKADSAFMHQLQAQYLEIMRSFNNIKSEEEKKSR